MFICGVTAWYCKSLKVTSVGHIAPMPAEPLNGRCASADNYDSLTMPMGLV